MLAFGCASLRDVRSLTAVVRRQMPALILGTVAALIGAGMFAFGLFMIEADLNLFSWIGQTGEHTIPGAFMASLGFAGLFGLLKITESRYLIGLIAVLSLGFAFIGVASFGYERLQPNEFLGRNTFSPTWYRGARLVLLSLPLSLCIYRYLEVLRLYKARKPQTSSPDA